MTQRSWLPVDRIERRGLLALFALALLAFLLRLVPVLLGGGLGARIGLDDGTYFAGAISFVEGRLPYRDFNILHPPGILYLLAPYGALAGATNEAAAMGVVRMSFMLLGAVNTFLVGLVGRRAGWGTALCAAALYAVWSVPAQWERSSYLIGPQATLMLLALLQLSGRGPEELTTRRVALAGFFIGVTGVFQVWGIMPAAIVLLWLVATLRAEPARALRRGLTYVVTGATTALLLLAPFLLLAGQQLFQMVILAQLTRTGAFNTGRMERLRIIEGVPSGSLGHLIPNPVVIIVFAAAIVLTGYVAWRRPTVRLWASVAAVELAFILATPVFISHYAGWPAAVEALCIGAVAAYVIERVPGWLRWVPSAAFAVLVLALTVSTMKPAGFRSTVDASHPDLSGARCVIADEGQVMIQTQSLIRSLRNGCRYLPNPRGYSHITDALRDGKFVNRLDQPEFQASSLAYYTSGDVAMFRVLGQDGLTEETWAAIKAAMPYEERIGPVIVLRKAAP